MTAPHGIRAVFLDLDDTLVLTSKGDVRALEEVGDVALALCPGVGVPELLAAWRQLFKVTPWDPEHKVEVERWRAGLWLKALEAQPQLCGRSGLDGVATALQERFSSSRIEAFKFLPSVEAMLLELRNKYGLKLVIITNGHADVQAAKIASCGARDLVDHVLIGGEEIAAGRHEKPHASIYSRACQLAGCSMDEAIMVGDNYTCDIQGAAEAGLAATVWINEVGKSIPENGPVKPTYILESVVGLADILGLQAQ